MSIKPSMYNILVKKDRNIFLVYNILSGILFQCGKDVYDYLDCKGDRDLNISIDVFEKLKENRLIVSEDENEFITAIYEKNRHIYGTDKMFAMILPTNACNFDCVYCPQISKPHFMNKSICDNIVNFTIDRARYSKSIHIEWFGGEPLLSKEIICYFMSTLKEKVQQTIRVPIISAITTNGYLLDLETFQQFKRLNILYYQITIDGNEKHHNQSRPLKTGGETYSKIFNNLIDIKNNEKSGNFKIVIRMNVDVSFFEGAEQFILECSKYFLGDTRFCFLPKLVTNLGGKKIEKIKNRLIHEQDYISKLEDMIISAGLILYNGIDKDDICYASYVNSFVFNYDGEIYKCNTIMTSDNALDKIKERNHIGTFKNGRYQIEENKIAEWVKREPYAEQCMCCNLFPICIGGRCPYIYHYANKKEVNQCLKSKENLICKILNLYEQNKYVNL